VDEALLEARVLGEAEAAFWSPRAVAA